MKTHPMFCLLSALACLGLGAADGPTWGSATRLGITPTFGQTGAQASRAAFLLGGELSYGDATWEGFAGVEFRHFNAAPRVLAVPDKGYYRTADQRVQQGYMRAALLVPGMGPIVDGTFDSGDLRRNALEGLGINLGLRLRPFPEWPLYVQGGLLVSNLKSTQEVTAGLRVLADPNATDPSQVLGQENVFTEVQASKVRPGLFLGLRYLVGPSLFLETQASLLGVTEVDYRPFTYTGRAPEVVQRDRSKVVFEFNAGFRF